MTAPPSPPSSGNGVKIGLLVLALVWASSPLWTRRPRDPALDPEASRPPASAPSPALASQMQNADRFDMVTLEAGIARQLDRHARLRATGYYDVLDDPNAPAELRDRIQAEHDRLEALTAEHPEQNGNQVALPSRQIDREGNLGDELALTLEIKRQYGHWDEFNQNHLRELRRRRDDPTLPEDQRPTEADIRRAYEDRAVPLF